MTTTATRPKKKKTTKKKASKKTKKTAGRKPAAAKKSRKTTTKKPKWVLVNYKQIEARREELEISKSAMATLLGVTNSTYHNWRRKTTVPHEAQQEKILKAMHAGPSIVPKTRPKAAGKKTTSRLNGAAARPSRSERMAGLGGLSDPFGSDSFLGDATGADHPSDGNLADSRTLMPARGVVVGGSRCNSATAQPTDSGQSHPRPAGTKVRSVENATVSAIACSYITAAKGKASAASIIKLVEGLIRVL